MADQDALSHYESILHKASELEGKHPDKAARLCQQVLHDIECGSAPPELRVKALYGLAMGHSHAGLVAETLSALNETLQCAKE